MRYRKLFYQVKTGKAKSKYKTLQGYQRAYMRKAFRTYQTRIKAGLDKSASFGRKDETRWNQMVRGKMKEGVTDVREAVNQLLNSNLFTTPKEREARAFQGEQFDQLRRQIEQQVGGRVRDPETGRFVSLRTITEFYHEKYQGKSRLFAKVTFPSGAVFTYIYNYSPDDGVTYWELFGIEVPVK